MYGTRRGSSQSQGEVSVGEQSQAGIIQEEAALHAFCTPSQHSHMDQRKALPGSMQLRHWSHSLRTSSSPHSSVGVAGAGDNRLLTSQWDLKSTLDQNKTRLLSSGLAPPNDLPLCLSFTPACITEPRALDNGDSAKG